MAFRYPRRVKDLPSLDLDSEDELNTPAKPKRYEATRKQLDGIRTGNKENLDTRNNNNNASGYSFPIHTQTFPKRISELPVLETDSEEEESAKNDHLNCAILNDSFILSPGRPDIDESLNVAKNSSSEIYCKKDEKNATFTDSMSFVLRFDKMALSNNVGKHFIEQSPVISSQQSCLKPTTTTTMITSTTTKTVNQNKAADAAAAITKCVSDLGQQQVNANETQFATPQVRTFSIRRRQPDLSSAQSQKKRSEMLNEFRSQKVLFQTPMALSRVPLSCLSNDSLALSLCDTITEMPNTSNPLESNSPLPVAVVKDNAPTGRTKKSLEAVFTAQTQQNIKPCRELPPTSTSKCVKQQAQENILQINGVGYAILQKLGSGGSSSVYSARRKTDGNDCALKVVDLQCDPAVVEGYLNETKLLAKLQGNPSVVTLYDYQLLQRESRLYVIMEKGDSDLNKILRAYTTDLPSYVLMNYLYQMLQAVSYIHQNGVIHSDLKPANFLMVNDRLKLIDFGIASNIAVDSTSIIKNSQAGTFNYISPEALTDTSSGNSPSNQPKIKLSTKSDVWSLGCILYLFLYKRTPFSHIKMDHAKVMAISDPNYIIEFPPLKPYYPIMLLQMVKMCLKHNTKERPTCAELLSFPFEMVIPIQNLKIQQ